MKNNNVCKFAPTGISMELQIQCFVLETNKENMRKEKTLTSNRMILIEQGEGEFLFDGVSYSFSTGTLIFGFEGETFSLSKGENVRYVYIDFGGVRANALCHRLGIYQKSRKQENFNSIIPFVKDCLLSTKQENIDMVSESVLLYVLSRLSVDRPGENDTIRKIIEYTEENFHSHDLSIVTISKEIGYNPKYLSHFFKEKMNVSYSKYLRSFRFKYAISLFELGLSSIKNVAFLSGFSDPLYFSSSFKKEIGISPKEFISKRSIAAKSEEQS